MNLNWAMVPNSYLLSKRNCSMRQMNNSKLYFIDDEDAPHIYHKLMAIESGYSEDQIESFYGVDDAIGQLKSMIDAKELSQWPKYVFVDINMPHKSGYDFINEIKEFVSTDLMPAIYFVSSSMNPRDIKRVEEIDIIKGFETKFLEVDFFMNLQKKSALYWH